MTGRIRLLVHAHLHAHAHRHARLVFRELGLVVEIGDDLTGEFHEIILQRQGLALSGFRVKGMRDTYSEFTNLRIVDTEDLGLFRGTEAETRDHIHDEEDETGSAERVGKTGRGVGDLVCHLNPVTVEPSSLDDRVAIKMSYVVTSSGQYCARAQSFSLREQETYAAKKPVRIFPTIPPMACSAKMSRASSTPTTNFSFVA